MIPYPKKDGSIVSVAMSIAETGHVGIDFDQREAELKAIKEALGPALKEGLTTALTKEQEK